MKKVRIAVFALLAAVLLSMALKVGEYKTTLSEKDRKIEAAQGRLTEAETLILKQDESLKQKDEYITELNASVDSLTADLKTLEEKLNELISFQSKLK